MPILDNQPENRKPNIQVKTTSHSAHTTVEEGSNYNIKESC
jgi:hypothetical protein